MRRRRLRSPVCRGLRRPLEGRSDRSVGHSVPRCGVRADGLREDHRQDPSLGVEQRPTRVPGADQPADRSHRSFHRSLAVGVVGLDGLGRADPRHVDRQRAAFRVACDLAFGSARRAGRDRQRRQGEAGDVEHRDVVVRIEFDDLCGQRFGRPGLLDGRVLLSGDDVRVRDHRVGSRDPARALDAHATGVADDANHAALVDRDRRRPRDSSVGRADRGARAVDRGQWIQVRERA